MATSWRWLLIGVGALSASCDRAGEAPASSPAPVASVEIADVSAAPITTASAAPASRVYQLDGTRLGDGYAEVMKRAPYQEPCDNDPIDEKRRRFMVYGAKPCRDRIFPEQTTVLFYLAFSNEGRYAQPIEAIAWLGGAYFEKRSDFPLAIGITPEAAEAKLGKAIAELDLRGGGQGLKVRQHPGDVYSVALGHKIVGYVIGPMPADAANEQWRGLSQMYFRYTHPNEAIQNCCIALGRRALDAGGADARAYLDARVLCEQLEMASDGIARLGEVRALVGKAAVPSECR